MGSLVVKLDQDTTRKIRNRTKYVDVDMFVQSSDLDGDIPMLYDVEAVKQSIRNILMWRVGENILRPEFGHNIYKSMYEQLNDFNKEKVCQEIKRAIEVNEPRVEVLTVAVKVNDDDDDNQRLHVQVVYSVIGQEGSQFINDEVITGK